MNPCSLLFRIFFVAGLLLSTGRAGAQDFDRQADVVYGYKDGMALVMDVYMPKGGTNGAGVIRLMSGGMSSSPVWSHQAADHPVVQALIQARYVVFAVAHSSQPRYTIEDILPDAPRAVRFIRHQAGRFGIDPQRIGIVGASSGGQLSLLAAAAPPSADPGARDPVDRESSAVQAVVAYFPGVDNLNFGRANATILDHFLSQQYKAEAMFDFRRWDDTTNRYERVSDPEARREAFRRTSPLAHVSAATPPVLLFHGDQDRLVPIQQSRLLAARLQELGVPHRLVVAEGKGHGWKPPLEGETTEVTEWFGKYLLGAKR